MTIGPDGKITDVNAATEHATGCTRAQLIGTDFADYFTEPDKARQGYQQVFCEGQVRDYPLEIRHKDGHLTAVLYNASVYRNEAGQVIGVFAAARDISERKRTEEALRLANVYNRSLIEASLDPLVTIGPDGKITDVNTATEEVTGRSRQELIGTDFADYFTEPDKARAGYQEVFREGSVRDYPLEIRHRSGRLTLVLYNACVYRDPAGKVVGVFAAARDISERKRTEEALRRANVYNRSLIEASLDPLVTIGPDGKITDVNTATEKVTGRSRQELIGTDFADYFTEPDKARQGYQQVFRESTVRDYPLEIRGRDGNSVPVLYNASVYRDETGRVVGVFAAARDITERKRAEGELKASENRFRSLVTATSQMVWTTDQAGQVTEDIPSWRAFTGQRLDEVRGTGWLGALHPEDRERAWAVWSKAITERSLYEVEYRVRRPDGEYRDFLARGVPVLESDGSVREWVGTCTDITERKRMEAALAQRAEALERSNKELEQFAYVASHDLQEPLRMIASYVELLAQRYKGQLDDKADKFIHYIVDGATRMQTLINDLLAFSRVATRGKPFTLSSAETALAEVLVNLQKTIADKGALVTHDPLPDVVVDPTQFEQVLQNLIGNGLKFCERTPLVHLHAEREGNDWLFSVRDNGIGIAREHLDRLFVIFQRLHSRTEYPGTGIGLAVCKKIIERHGGRIWLESEPGKGSTFFFTIPAQREVAS